MPRDSKILEARNKAIQKKYKELYEVKKLRSEAILQKLSETFFLSEITISRILFKPKAKAKLQR